MFTFYKYMFPLIYNYELLTYCQQLCQNTLNVVQPLKMWLLSI